MRALVKIQVIVVIKFKSALTHILIIGIIVGFISTDSENFIIETT